MSLEHAVRAVHGLDSLLALLRDELRWPLDKSAALADSTFDWTPGELRVLPDHAARLKDGLVRQLRPLTPSQPWGVFFVEFSDGRVYRTALRQVLRGLVPSRRKDPDLQSWQRDNLLFICTTKECDRFTFAHFRGEKAPKAKLCTFGWERDDPYVRTLCEYNLPALGFPDDGGEDAPAWLAKWAKAFDKEPLTREFFRRFDLALDALKADLQTHQGFNSADAYSRAQLLLERLLFLYFLQKRGWLNQQPSYLLDHFQPHRDRPDGFSYYHGFLEKLFWTLASPPGPPNRFEGIPFLNGGLFDDDEFAPPPHVRFKHFPPLNVRNSTFAHVFDELLEAFNFTVREDTPLNQDVAVDPEMLGKVFESIVLHAEAADPDAVAPDKRKATGSYYTPRIVVHFICREALRQYLLNHLTGDDWGPRLRELLDLDATDGLDADELSRLRTLLTADEGARLRDLIHDLKCCDPAVGSGAFPVGLLHELVNLRRVAETAANGYVDPVRSEGSEWVHKAKAHFVENSLYGVDIQQQAIEICRLRLWLSLVVDYDPGIDPFTASHSQFLKAIDRISQLPNLEMNFRRGDSLLDHVSGVPVRVEPGAFMGFRQDVEAIEKLARQLHRAAKAERKRKLRLDILRCRLGLTERVLNGELQKLREHPDSIELLPGIEEAQSKAEKRRRLAHETEQVRAALAKVASDRRELEELARRAYDSAFYPKLRRLEGADFDSPFNFAWRLDFPALFAPPTHQAPLTTHHPGFDLIVGNPPFVTARNPVKRELYRERWKRVCSGTYLLICPFFDLSFGLLRPGGQLGFIVSNAFAKREFGKPLVEDFFPTVDIQKVIDCSGLMFPGHGTPTCIVFGRNQKPDPRSPIRVAAILPGGGDLRTPPEESPLWHTLAERHDDGGFSNQKVVISDWNRAAFLKWPLNLDVEADSLRRRMEENRVTTFGDVIEGTMGRVCFTGADELFFVSEDMLRRMGVTTDVIARFAPGDLVRNWSHDETHCISPYNNLGALVDESEARQLLAYLQPWKQFLCSRLSYEQTQEERGLAWWEYSIVFPERIQGQLALSVVEIATHNHVEVMKKAFIANRDNPVINLPANSTDADHHLLAGLLNSSAALFWLKQVCFSKRESAEGVTDTYFEFAGGKVEQLPVPEAIAKALSYGPASAAAAKKPPAQSRSPA